MRDFNFAEEYKRISNTALFDILENAGDYQLPAIEAAKNELNNRQLSALEIDEARAPLLVIQIEKDRLVEKNKISEDKLKAAGNSIYSRVNPFDTDDQDSHKKILVIIIIYGGSFIVQVTRQFSMILQMIKEITRFPLQVSMSLFPLLVMPVALITFWKRKAIGWTLLALCVTFTAVSNFMVIYEALTYEPSILLSGYFRQKTLKASDIFYLFIMFSVLYVMCKKSIREIYKIDIPKMAGIIFIGCLLSILIISGNVF